MRKGLPVALFHEFLGDIRFGFRRLGKYPLPAAVAIFTLVLGLGANIAAFCYVNAAFLRPLPYRDSSELVVVSEFNGKVSSAAMKSSWPNLEDWRRQTQSILRLAGYRDQRFTVTGSGGPERAAGPWTYDRR